jgi:hypothetical protein
MSGGGRELSGHHTKWSPSRRLTAALAPSSRLVRPNDPGTPKKTRNRFADETIIDQWSERRIVISLLKTEFPPFSPSVKRVALAASSRFLMTDVAQDLTSYAHSSIVDIRAQFITHEKEWTKYVEHVIKAYNEASDKHRSVLDAVAQRKAAEAQLFVAALAIAAGPALSWLSGAIQYRWYGRFAPEIETKVQTQTHWIYEATLGGGGVDVGTPVRVVTNAASYNKVAAKVFGDFGRSLGGVLGEYIKSKLPNPPDYAGSVLPGLASPAAFDQSIKDTLSNSFTQVEEAMNDAAIAANGLLDGNTYGERCIRELYRMNPSLKMSASENLRIVGRGYVNSELMNLMNSWAANSIVFKYNPPNVADQTMADAIETNIWANWILYNDFEYDPFRSGEAMGRNLPGGAITIEREVQRELERLNICSGVDGNSWNPFSDRPNGANSCALNSAKATQRLNDWAKTAHKPIDTFSAKGLKEWPRPTLPEIGRTPSGAGLVIGFPHAPKLATRP